MAHLVENMFFVGERPWHKLGIEVNENVTIEEGIKFAGLDWRVTKEKLYLSNGTPIDGKFATVRSTDNQPLGVVGENYTILQNSEAFNFFQPFLDMGHAKLNTAGSLQDGKKIWVLAKINDFSIADQDKFENYILLSNSHDGSQAISVGFTQVRVVCNNTLTMALNDDASKLLKVRHTKNVNLALDIIQSSMDCINKQIIGTKETYEKMIKYSVDTNTLDNYFNQVLGLLGKDQDSSRVKKKLLEHYETGLQTDLDNNLYRAFNAVTEFDTHIKNFRSQDSKLGNAFNLSSLGNRAYKVAELMVA